MCKSRDDTLSQLLVQGDAKVHSLLAGGAYNQKQKQNRASWIKLTNIPTPETNTQKQTSTQNCLQNWSSIPTSKKKQKAGIQINAQAQDIHKVKKEISDESNNSIGGYYSQKGQNRNSTKLDTRIQSV